MRDANERLREATGRVRDTSALVSFLYDLMRDHVPVGYVEQACRCCEVAGGAGEFDEYLAAAWEAISVATLSRLRAVAAEDEGRPLVYTNGWLARYAQDVADRLAALDNAAAPATLVSTEGE